MLGVAVKGVGRGCDGCCVWLRRVLGGAVTGVWRGCDEGWAWL